jgi:hypothetical protein
VTGRILAALVLASTIACAPVHVPAPKGAHPARGALPPPPEEVHWEDALATDARGTPDIVFTMRPQALRRDPTYGPFLDALLKLLAAHSAEEGTEDVWGDAIGSMGSAESLTLVLADHAGDDMLLALEGIDAALDPASLRGAKGPFWQRPTRDPDARPTGADEFVSADGQGVSLFVLPHRTWVLATGRARARMRDAIDHLAPPQPQKRPLAGVDRDALALLRLDGPRLVRALGLTARPALAPLGRALESVTCALEPGPVGSLVAHFAYRDVEDATSAEELARRIQAAFAGAQASAETASAGWKWLVHDTHLGREGRIVTIEAPVPQALLGRFAHASPSELRHLTAPATSPPHE